MYLEKHQHIISTESLAQRERMARPTSERITDVHAERKAGALPRQQLAVVADGRGSFVDSGRHSATVAYVESLHAVGDTAECLLKYAREGFAKFAGHEGAKARETFIAALADDCHAIDALIEQLAGVRTDLGELLVEHGVTVACEADAPSWRGEPRVERPASVYADVAARAAAAVEPVVEPPPPPEPDSPEIAAQKAANAARKAQRYMRRHGHPPDAA